MKLLDGLRVHPLVSRPQRRAICLDESVRTYRKAAERARLTLVSEQRLVTKGRQRPFRISGKDDQVKEECP